MEFKSPAMKEVTADLTDHRNSCLKRVTRLSATQTNKWISATKTVSTNLCSEYLCRNHNCVYRCSFIHTLPFCKCLLSLNYIQCHLNINSKCLAFHNLHHVLKLYFVTLTLRRLMSYIYGAPILDVSRSHTTTQHSR